MTSTDRNEPPSTLDPKEAAELGKYGIVQVSVNYFHYGSYRYTNLADAIAEAKRRQAQAETRST